MGYQVREASQPNGMFHATRVAAIRSVADQRDNQELVAASIHVRSPKLLSAVEVVALAEDDSAAGELLQAGYDAAMDAERTVLFATAESAITVEETNAFSNAHNFRVTDETAAHIGGGSGKAKLADNLAALKLLKTLERGHRRPTPEEQERLAAYVDFGGLRKIWDQAYGFRAENQQLNQILTPEELAAIKETSINTHYTSMMVVDGVWEGVERLGFDGGRVLEPGMGVGTSLGECRPRSQPHRNCSA